MFVSSMTAMAAPPSEAWMTPAVSIVRATVQNEREVDGMYEHQVRIEHVYGDVPLLEGAVFITYSADHQPQGGTRIVVPRLAIGESCFWAVRSTGAAVSPRLHYNDISWPVSVKRSQIGQPFEVVGEFATAAEETSRLTNRGELVAKLKASAVSMNPYVSSWSISRLPTVSDDADDVFKFLMGLAARDNIPIRAQVELDKRLLEIRPDGWQGTDARAQLFSNWFSRAMSDRDSSLVVDRLEITTQHPATAALPQERVLGLAKSLAENAHFPLFERQRVASIISWASKRFENDEEPFELAVLIVGSELPVEVRRNVARVVSREFDLDERRAGMLRRLRDKEKDVAVAKFLDKALSGAVAPKP